uniref:Odorant binding protein 5 n=1 Tax=Grapholita molesta TaxID=192188 RepID=A0A2R4SBB9_GRAMO|nr:odorant binding protein 5 [Grapholita molesta]
MSFNNFVVFIAVCLSYSVQADSVANMKMKYLQYMLTCAEQHSVATTDLKEVTQQKMLKDDNVKCMFACVFKMTGMTDDEGNLSVEGIKQVTELVYANNPEKKAMSEDFIKACKHVNDEELTGEKKECQRAALIFKCSVENSASR